ncbi:hypothetical protein N8525_03925 [Verrucomicrobiales bacterium]|nr:hypothetical protein [Verrucomicrobiales bacterium]
MNTLRTSLTLGVLIAATVSVGASDRDLYRTDFSDFGIGENQLVGTDSWEGTNVTEGVHGIDEGLVSGQGNTAYLGANEPEDGTSLVSVHRTMDELATDVVRFQAIMGITESVERGNDIFSFGFFNEDGETLGTIYFDTTLFDYGVWTGDGRDATYTGEDFLSDYIHTLTVTIDLRANVWSADLDGIPLFDEIAFTAIESKRNVAGVAVEWEILDTTFPGDNWLLFDDLSLAIVGEATASPEADRSALLIERLEDGSTLLTWSTRPAARYQIEYSQDGIMWRRDLLDQEVAADVSGGVAQYVDKTSVSVGQRFYRIVTL